jgi:hypothetical protein
MNDRRMLEVSRQRPVHPYAELWHASHCVLEVGLNEPRRSSWQFLSSAVLTAFTFEAYLNHIGAQIMGDWPAHERFAMWSKFKLLRKTLGVTFPGGKSVRPLKTVAELFTFRDSLAHGKSLELKDEKKQSLAVFEREHSDLIGSQLRTDWESRIRTSAFAQRAREDVEVVIRALDAARKDKRDILFNSGVGSHLATVAA